MPSDTSASANIAIEELLEKFSSGTLRQRRRLVDEVESRSDELKGLGSKLFETLPKESDDWSKGWILQVLNRHHNDYLKDLLAKDSSILFDVPSSSDIDYGPLQQSLIEERFEEADRITSETLRCLAGPSSLERGYVYFSEVEAMSEVDLISLDLLWNAFSQDKFGFSVQARLLESLGGRYDKLWSRIGWKVDGTWTRYPIAFTWSLKAPEGHMPLVNQLRGVRLMDAYLNHPFLKSRLKKS